MLHIFDQQRQQHRSEPDDAIREYAVGGEALRRAKVAQEDLLGLASIVVARIWAAKELEF